MYALMKSSLAAALFAGVLVAAPAQATHIFVTDIEFNGIALDSTAGPTDPNIVVNAGGSITYSAGYYSDALFPDSFDWDFVQTGGSLAATPPTDTIISYPGTGTSASPLVISFSDLFATPGTWDGFISITSSLSCPSYRDPNGNETGGGCGASPSVSLPFSITVVPEPGTLALLALAFLGFTLARRRS